MREPIKINILGTEYSLSTKTEKEYPDFKGTNVCGMCEIYNKNIILKDTLDKENPEFKKQILRHEIIHAYFTESGLLAECPYAESEELVDWIAIQFPKMYKTFKETKAI